MFALRFVSALALTVWLGGAVTIGLVAAPAAFAVLPSPEAATSVGETLRRFHLVTYAAGAVIVLLLVAMALLGPRPLAFGKRLSVAGLMLAASLVSGLWVDGRIAAMRAEIRVPVRIVARRRRAARRLRSPAWRVDAADGGHGARRGGAGLLEHARRTMSAGQTPGASAARRRPLAEQILDARGRAPDGAAAMATAVARLKGGVPAYTWVGIYLLVGNELVLGPYEGKPSPHTRIPLGRGICGAAATERTTIIVDDVTRIRATWRAASRRARRSSCPSCAAPTCSARSTSTATGRRPSGPADRRCSSAWPPRSRHGSRPLSVTTRMTHRITLIPGDGIGPEVTRGRLRILKVAGLAHRVGAVRGRASPRSSGTARRCRSSCSTRSAGTASPSRARSPRRSARGSPASTSACARRSSSSPTCGPSGTCRGRALALLGRRPGDRPREHRRPLLRPRARGGARRRREPEGHHGGRLDAASRSSPSRTRGGTGASA
jgi:uncharacterized membrane protein